MPVDTVAEGGRSGDGAGRWRVPIGQILGSAEDLLSQGISWSDCQKATDFHFQVFQVIVFKPPQLPDEPALIYGPDLKG